MVRRLMRGRAVPPLPVPLQRRTEALAHEQRRYLQVFAWLVRGVVFQFIGLTGAATYLRMHYALQPSGVRVPEGLLTRT